MLTHTQCKNAVCPGDKQRARLADAGDLYLEVVPSGSKRWFWKYYFNGKEKRLALGSYPGVGLKEARVARDDARKQQHRGADPVLERQVVRLSSKFDANATFEVTARKFHVTKKAGWSDHYAKRWLERISKDVFPWLGKSLPCPKSARPRCCRPCGGSRAAGYANCRTRCSRRAARCSDTACQLVDANAIRRSISEAR